MLKREHLDQEAYQAGLSGIYTDAVADVINTYSMNVVLGVHYLSIEAEIRRLHRQIMCETSNEDVRNFCPACVTCPHKTLHLFNCPFKPTLLTPEDFYLQPVEVVEFINLDSEPV